MSTHQSKFGRRYDEEFKREVAALAARPETKDEQVARDLGVSVHSVARWRRRYGPSPAASTAVAAPTGAAVSVHAASREELGAGGARVAPRGRRGAPAAREPKKSLGHLLGTPALKMAAAAQLVGQHPVAALCRTRQISRAGFYASRYQAIRPRAQANARLGVSGWRRFSRPAGALTGADASPPPCGGSGSLAGDTARLGSCAAGGCAPLKYAGCPKQKRRFRPKTTDSAHLCPIAPNRLAARSAPPTRPAEVWLADITSIATAEGWLYLAGVLDLYSRRLVGWATDEIMPTALVARAFQRAVAQRRPPAGLLHHCDRGSQYASDAYRQLLHVHGVESSMSRQGNCYDNAAMESFWATLKTELIDGRLFNSRAQARREIFSFIEVFYNRKRLHGALGYQTPVEYEANLN